MTATAYGFLLRASTQPVAVPGDQRRTRPARRDDEPLRSQARWPATTSRPCIKPVTIASNYQSIGAFCPLAIKPFHDLPLKSGGVSNMKNILDLLCDARGEPSWRG